MLEKLDTDLSSTAESAVEDGLLVSPKTPRPSLTRRIGNLAGRASVQFNSMAIKRLHWQFGTEQHQQVYTGLVIAAAGLEKVASAFHSMSDWMEVPARPTDPASHTHMDE